MLTITKSINQIWIVSTPPPPEGKLQHIELKNTESKSPSSGNVLQNFLAFPLSSADPSSSSFCSLVSLGMMPPWRVPMGRVVPKVTALCGFRILSSWLKAIEKIIYYSLLYNKVYAILFLSSSISIFESWVAILLCNIYSF